MVIETSRFGKVEIPAEDVLTFSDGLLGFADLKRFVLLDDPSDEIFAWLQSCESPHIAFPVLEPELFSEVYRVNLTKSDATLLKVEATSLELLNENNKLNVGDVLTIKSSSDDKNKAVLKNIRFFTIITIPDDPTQMTANLKAPVVINVALRVARQCVLQDNQLAIREPIFAKLQQRVLQNPSVAIKNQSSGIDVAFRLKGASMQGRESGKSIPIRESGDLLVEHERSGGDLERA